MGRLTMALLPSPDVFGYTIFCEDIRQEFDGKLSFIGAYPDLMIVHVPFPAKLPIFAMRITLIQSRKVFIPRLGLRVFVPGDSDDAASIQAEMGEVTDGGVAAAVSAETERLHLDTQVPFEDRYITLQATLKFVQFEIKQPGILKVRAVVGDNMIRLGAMRISPPPQANPT